MRLLNVPTNESSMSLRNKETIHYCKNVLGLNPTFIMILHDGSVVYRADTPVRVAEPRLLAKFAQVIGDFTFVNPETASLYGSPSKVGGNFRACHTKITSLEGGPSVIEGSCDVSRSYLTSINGVARTIGGSLDLRITQIKSLQGIEKKIHHLGRALHLPTSLQSHLLGIFLIPHFTGPVQFEFDVIQGGKEKLSNIINGHLKDKDVHACQQELIDAGYEKFARL